VAEIRTAAAVTLIDRRRTADRIYLGALVFNGALTAFWVVSLATGRDTPFFRSHILDGEAMVRIAVGLIGVDAGRLHGEAHGRSLGSRPVELDGTVEIRGVPCKPGDLVCADEAGVAILPQGKLAAVLEVCLRIDAADTRRKADIDAGVPIADLVTKQYK